MGKLQRRLTIIPKATLLGWRRLRPDSNEFSGQLYSHDSSVNTYMSYIKFDFVTHFPELSGRWDEHYLGERDGVFITMFVKHQSIVRSSLL